MWQAKRRPRKQQNSYREEKQDKGIWLNAEAERKRAEENERNRILSVYETEADIDRQRDQPDRLS